MNGLLINLGLQSFTAPPVRKKVAPKEPNATEKADSPYIKALKIKPMSVKELAYATKNTVGAVQRRVRVLEQRGTIEIAERVQNGANPRIIWRLKK